MIDWSTALMLFMAGISLGAGCGKLYGEGRAERCCSLGGELVEGACVKKGSRLP